MNDIWERIKQQLGVLHHPSLENLAIGAADVELTKLELLISIRVDDFFESLRVVNGQKFSTPVFYYQFAIFSIDEIIDHYSLMNNEVAPDLVESGIDLDEGDSVGPIKPQIWNSKWIPFAGDGGNFLCVDLDPDVDGRVGQIFSWWRDSSPNEWIAPSYRAWLEQFLSDLEGGKFYWDADSNQWLKQE